jgi:hypothetical protein
MAGTTAQILTGSTSGATLTRDVLLEVKEAFDRQNKFMDKIEVKTIESGHGAQFIIGGKDTYSLAKTQGRSGASTAIGADIDVNDVKLDQRLINITDTVYDARRIDGKEEKMAEYDVRAPITNMIGSVLAQKMDITIVAQLGLACEATGIAGNPNAPAVVVNAVIASGSDAKTRGNAMAEAIFKATASLRKVDNYNELYVAVDPDQYADLVQSDRAVSVDYTSGNGGIDTGKVLKVGGAMIFETNHLSFATNIEGIKGIVFSKEAVGMVKLQDVATEVNYDFNKFATLMSGRYAIGCGILRPECAVGIASSVQS